MQKTPSLISSTATELNFNKILEVVSTLFIQSGFRNVSMDNLAKSLGISKKTLYMHTHSKDDLILAFVEKYLFELQSQTNLIIQNSINALDELMKIMIHIKDFIFSTNHTLWLEIPKYYPYLLPKLEYKDKFYFEHIKHNLQRGIMEGIYRANINIDIIAKFYLHSSTTVFHDMLQKDYTDVNKVYLYGVYEELIQYHIHGILSPLGLQILEEQYHL